MFGWWGVLRGAGRLCGGARDNSPMDENSIPSEFEVPPATPRPVSLKSRKSHFDLTMASFWVNSLKVPIKQELPPLEPPVKRRRRRRSGQKSLEEREAEIEASLEACTEETSSGVQRGVVCSEKEVCRVLTNSNAQTKQLYSYADKDQFDREVCLRGLKAWAELYLLSRKSHT